MANNYKGYFRGVESDKRYVVKIIGNSASTDFIDIELAGSDPFTVTYNTSETPFEPVRTSTASINVVRNDYMADILSPYAQGTEVSLYLITTVNKVDIETLEWTGYLTPKVYDASYVDEYETFTLEAADCISSLQYIDYTTIGTNREIVSIKDILNEICDATNHLDGYYWSATKYVDGNVLVPSNLRISEMNFYSTDTDEVWQLDEMLEEICRYFGMTCLQWKGYMYFIDYQYFSKNEYVPFYLYLKSSSYKDNATVRPSIDPYTITAEKYMDSDATISFEPVYHKVYVTANMNCNETFIPELFADENLTNRNGDFYSSFQVPAITPNASYPNGAKNKDEDVADTQYDYWYRLYDNKYWESQYGDTLYANPTTPKEADLTTSAITRSYFGGTIVDLGVVDTGRKNDSQQWVIPNTMDYTRYLCINEAHNNLRSSYTQTYGSNIGMHGGKTVMKLKDGFKPNIIIDTTNSFLVLKCSCIFEKYEERPYINPEWVNSKVRKKGLSAGFQTWRIAKPMFRLIIGNKAWSGFDNKWVSSSATNNYFTVTAEWDSDDYDFWNKSITTLNEVEYTNYVNESGYQIPLEGVDLTQEIHFEILCPNVAQYYNEGNPGFNNHFMEYNSYCWMSDFTLKCVTKNQDADKEESDIVYGNMDEGDNTGIIDKDAVSELSDITVKLTSWSELTQPSYSNVGYYSGGTVSYLSAVTEPAINGIARKPEENIVEKYVYQYKTQTRKFDLTLDLNGTQLMKFYGADVENPEQGYVPLGTTIDYQYDRQTITLVEKK